MSVNRYSVGYKDSASGRYAAMLDKQDGGYVSHEDYAALEARCAALAVENAGLKDWSPNPHSASMFEAIEKAEALMDDGMPELAMIKAFEILKMKRPPATDAFLAEVRAQGVEIFAQWCRGERDFTLIDEDISDAAAYEECIKRAEYFAAHLRKGVQS